MDGKGIALKFEQTYLKSANEEIGLYEKVREHIGFYNS
jgi:hypothetical protein